MSAVHDRRPELDSGSTAGPAQAPAGTHYRADLAQAWMLKQVQHDGGRTHP
jgi:hypothetical protein